MSAARGEAGFTLVELLLSLALTGMIMAMTLPFVDVQKRLWERREDGREARRALTGALAWVTRDLEQVGYHDPGQPLRLVEPQAISYVVSRDASDPARFSPANRRLITLWLDAGDLKYKIQAPLEPPDSGWERGSTQVLASGLGGMHCRALDGDGAETPSLAQTVLLECLLAAADGKSERLLVRPGACGRDGAP